jgi:prophage antirepressor-like protein
MFVDFELHHPSANAMNTEPWVTAADVAQHLGVAKDSVYRWRERKGLPAHQKRACWWTSSIRPIWTRLATRPV